MSVLLLSVEDDQRSRRESPASPGPARTCERPRFGTGCARTGPSTVNWIRFQNCPQPQSHKLDFTLGVGVPITALMFVFEVCNQFLQEWKVQLIPLAAVAKVDAAMITR